MLKKDPSCVDDFERDALTPGQALDKILAAAVPAPEQDALPVRETLGRIVAEDIVSNIDVPSHTNSAVDGYAIAGEELPTSGSRSFNIVGTAWAGKPFERSVAPDGCVRIMTGAKMPGDMDTVVMQEHVEPGEKLVRIGPGHRRGENVRQAGEDLAKGQIALAAGTVITPTELGLITSIGLSEICVTRQLKVAFFSTGDELRSVGEPIQEGEIYDSNRYTLFGMLKRLGVEPVDLGVIGDDPEAIRNAFSQAAQSADAVITTGGVSVGDADYVKPVLDELGEVAFWKIAIKPGRPLAFGKIRNSLFFGLPGNPVAVMVTFYHFVKPALLRMMGASNLYPLKVSVKCSTSLRKKPGRTEYLRAVVKPDDSGQMVVERVGSQGSGILSSMSRANCFIVLPSDCAGVETGQFVDVELFHGLL